jgi:hypothetical protein
VIYDIVADVGEFDNHHDLFAIMHLLKELPHIYLDDVNNHVMECVQASPAEEGENKAVDLIFEGGI